MPRSRSNLTPMQVGIFHSNIKYMLQKLNTSFYQIKKDTTGSNRIEGGTSLLPAYSICSKCSSDPNYVPSVHTVNAIVQFYNKNLSPEISSYQFLNEDLEKTDSSRYRISTALDERFIGTFYGYYPSATEDGLIVGACLKIYKEVSMIKAVLVSGIRTDSELNGPALRSLFSTDHVLYKDFREYYSRQAPENQRTYYYEGTVEITSSSFLIHFRSPDEDSRKLTMTLNLDCFPASVRRPYMGGLAFMLATSDGPFDTRFYTMGLINSNRGFLSIQTEGISELLALPSGTHSLTLTSTQDRRWYEFILAHPGKKE